MAPLTLEEQFVELQKAKERPRNLQPKIQKVANYLRNRKHFAKHYSPKLVSFGPIHHGSENLQLGEQYKLTWAAKYIESTKLPGQILHKRIADNIEELKGLFAADTMLTQELEENLPWVLFVDGCALLHILKNAKLDEQHLMNVKVDQLALVMMDVLLLENQLPYRVLNLLWRDDNEAELMETMKKFLKCHHWANNSDQKQQNPRKRQDLNRENKEDQRSTVLDLEHHDEPPTHLLDLQRRIILSDAPHPKTIRNEANYKRTEKNSGMVTYRNIQELRAAGIRLKSSNTRRPRDVSFSHGWLAAELTLPEIVVDDTTAATFLNLIAYEMCPDFNNDYGICSFAAFMDSLIDHPEDVKALRSARILLNSLGSDEEVAKLFNIISTDLVPDTAKYSSVRDQIEVHYRNKLKTWLALGCHTYFSNPWAIIAFLAALLALALTFIQTWFAIIPAPNK